LLRFQSASLIRYLWDHFIGIGLNQHFEKEDWIEDRNQEKIKSLEET